MVLSLFRALLLIFDFPWVDKFSLFLVNYSTPIFLQFVSLGSDHVLIELTIDRVSLLIVFLVKCVLLIQQREGDVKRLLYPAFTILTLFVFAACFVDAWYAGHDRLRSKHC